MRSAAGTIVILQLLLWISGADAQPVGHAADRAALIEAKRMAIRHHTEKMQSIKEVAALEQEIRTHFGMVEELMGLIVEQQRQALGPHAGRPMQSIPTMQGERPMSGPPLAGQRGMMDDDGMEMSTMSPVGEMASGVEGEMEMPSTAHGGAQPAATRDDDSMTGSMGSQEKGATSGGMMGGMHSKHDMDGGASISAAAASASRLAEREALLAEMTRHSQFIASLSDPNARIREILRHQEMLDQLLELMR